MKTKQFMASRIFQQQEEIEMLKRSLMYHSGKHIEMIQMFEALTEEVALLKDKLKKGTSKDNNFNLSEDDFAASMECDENKDIYVSGYETVNVKRSQENSEKNSNKQLEQVEESDEDAINENTQLKLEKEKLGNELYDLTLELNKTRGDKFILFNELNELIMSLKKCNLDELNSFYKKELHKCQLTRNEMPISKGIKYNILSSQSQLAKLLRLDTIKSEITNTKVTSGEEGAVLDKMSLDRYLKLLKATEDEFEEILNRKLGKRGKSFIF